jgi:hypothetical protein
LADGVARPITIPQVMRLKTLADVRRQLSTWQHVETTLQACVAGEDPVSVSVALQLVLQADGRGL